MKHCTRKRNLILTTFTLYFQTVTVVGRHFFAKMISPEYVFSLLPTGFFIFLRIQQQCENVCYLLIDYIVYMVNNQSNRAQGSGLLRRRSVVSFNSELEVKTKVNSAFSRPYIVEDDEG